MKWIFGIILFWLTFVVSLAAWWLYFGVTTLGRAANAGLPLELARHQRMLFMEGCVLLVFLLGGGLGLFYFAYRMYKEKSAKEIFFASFTHDLKTALFRLQLEVEKMGEKSAGPDVDRILGHTRKMQLDLENSLDSTVGQNKQIFIEEINIKNLLLDMHAQWPEFRIRVTGDDQLRADKKALNSIFKNLLHNSFVHGGADEVRVNLSHDRNQFLLTYSDNGKAFEGDIQNLGKVYHHKAGGSGFGLFIVQQWVRRLGGRVFFKAEAQSPLQVSIEIPGGVAS